MKLDHYAYEGAQWAIANPSSATADPALHPGTGTIARHIYELMCGGTGSTPPSSGGSRFCGAQPTGVPKLTVKVDSPLTPTSLAPGVAPTGEVMGTSVCKLYTLSASPVSVVINQSTSPTSATFTITDTSAGGAGPNPTVTLTASGYPGWIQVQPIFFPSKITAGQSATVTVQAGSSTPAGTYTLSFDGHDDCTGLSAATGAALATLTVLASPGNPSPTATPAATVGITGILPGLICLNVSSPLTINGFGFQSGATVTTGPLSALSVTVVSSTQITINTAALLAGVYNLVVTNPGGATGTLNSGLTVSTSCGGGGGGGGGGATPTPTTSGCCFNGSVGTPGTTTLTDLTSSWTTNQWVGATVTMGGSSATVLSNNGTTLTFSSWTGGIPLPGPYTIQLAAGSTVATNACASNSSQHQTVITITWYEPLVIPMFAPSGTPYFTLQSVRYAFCQ